ncbi:hypothetical protein [Staphylococcus saprophyticus]|uniref:hypothetical protein n=1 Tax=Staphylococcus saprophyticus TaxID=29385 RepID=UPI0034C62EDF
MVQWTKDSIVKQVEKAKQDGDKKAALTDVDYQEVNQVCQVLADEKWIDIFVEKNDETEDYTVYIYDL